MLAEVTTSMAGLGKSLQDRQSFYESLNCLATLFQTEIHSQFSRHSFPGEDFRRRSTQINLLSSAKKSNIYFTGTPVLKNLFHRLSLSSGSASLPKGSSGSARSIYEKILFIADCIGNLDIAADSTLMPELACRDSATQFLSSALTFNFCPKPSLSNIDQRERLSTLEAQLRTIQQDMESLGLDTLHQPDRGQARFMDRWG